MKNILKLTRGELNRLIKYKILPISLATAVIWIILFVLISAEEALALAPIFIFTDIAMMLVILVGASFHLEKQEGTIKSMIMMPVTLTQILISKIISSMVLGLIALVVTTLSLYVIHGIFINIFLLLVFIVIASAFHAALGFSLALLSKDFTSMLGILISYMFIFTIPTLLFSFNIIDQGYEWILMLSPSHCASLLINSTVLNTFEVGKTLFSIVYLIAGCFLLMRYVVYPKFKSISVRG